MSTTNTEKWPTGYAVIAVKDQVSEKEARRRGEKREDIEPIFVGYILHRKLKDQPEQYCGTDMHWCDSRRLVNRELLFRAKKIGDADLSAEDYAKNMAQWQVDQDKKVAARDTYPVVLTSLAIPVCSHLKGFHACRVQNAFNAKQATTFQALKQALVQTSAKLKSGVVVHRDCHVIAYLMEQIDAAAKPKESKAKVTKRTPA